MPPHTIATIPSTIRMAPRVRKVSPVVAAVRRSGNRLGRRVSGGSRARVALAVEGIAARGHGGPDVALEVVHPSAGGLDTVLHAVAPAPSRLAQAAPRLAAGIGRKQQGNPRSDRRSDHEPDHAAGSALELPHVSVLRVIHFDTLHWIECDARGASAH